MKKVLLANIGNRNIKFGEKHIGKQNYYEETKAIFDDLKERRDEISIEILDSIIKEHTEISKIYLFVTNQTIPFHQDSYRVGKIIQTLRKETYDIELVEIKHDPRNRELSFKFFEDLLNQHPEFVEKTQIIVSGSGGIPACKEALNFYTVMNCRNVIITDVDENNGSIYTSEIATEYLKTTEMKTLSQMIEHFDYSGAYQFLQQSRIKNPKLSNRILYLSTRYNFDFQKSNNLLSQCSWNVGKIPEKEPEGITDIITYKEVMLVELFDNIEISFEKGEYTMVLGKTFALQENLYKHLFERFFQISCLNFNELVKLGASITQNRSGEMIIDKRFFQNKINEQYGNGSEDIKLTKKFCDILAKYKDLRNNSIVAHGFGGCTRDEVKPIVDAIVQYKQEYFKISENIFKKLNSLLFL